MTCERGHVWDIPRRGLARCTECDATIGRWVARLRVWLGHDSEPAR